MEEILSDHLENKRTGIKCLNALHLKILACALMLCYHNMACSVKRRELGMDDLCGTSCVPDICFSDSRRIPLY